MSDAPPPPTTDAASKAIPDAAIRFHRIRMELDRESDRGVALLSAAYVDAFLEKAVKSRLCDMAVPKGSTLFDRLFQSANPPLGSFSAKIDLAFAMKVIGPHTYHDLHIMRGVRNDFAHDLDFDNPRKGLSFEERSISDRCNNLWLPKNYIHMVNANLAEETIQTQRLDHPRGQYVYSALTIAHLIDMTVQQTDHVSRVIEEMTKDGKVPCVLPGSLV